MGAMKSGVGDTASQLLERSYISENSPPHLSLSVLHWHVFSLHGCSLGMVWWTVLGIIPCDCWRLCQLSTTWKKKCAKKIHGRTLVWHILSIMALWGSTFYVSHILFVVCYIWSVFKDTQFLKKKKAIPRKQFLFFHTLDICKLLESLGCFSSFFPQFIFFYIWHTNLRSLEHPEIHMIPSFHQSHSDVLSCCHFTDCMSPSLLVWILMRPELAFVSTHSHTLPSHGGKSHVCLAWEIHEKVQLQWLAKYRTPCLCTICATVSLEKRWEAQDGLCHRMTWWGSMFPVQRFSHACGHVKEILITSWPVYFARRGVLQMAADVRN